MWYLVLKKCGIIKHEDTFKNQKLSQLQGCILLKKIIKRFLNDVRLETK